MYNKKLFFLLIGVLSIFDIGIKYFVFSLQNLNTFFGISIIPSKNFGSAFGMFSTIPYYNYSIVILSLLIIAYIIYEIKHIKDTSYWMNIFIVLFLSGLIGNTYDRIVYGYVRDFIQIPSFAIINIADIYLTLAGIIAGIELLRQTKEFYSRKRKQNFKKGNSDKNNNNGK